MAARIERCETCRFWCDPEQLSDHWQECHRYPPTSRSDGEVRDHWPVTWESDWCGEWQPTPPAAATRDGG